MNKTILRTITLLWALCIAIGAVLRGYRMGALLQTFGFAHIATHFGVFAVLGCLTVLSFDVPRTLAIALLGGVTLGIATETYELLMFHGPMEITDVIVDVLGLVLGAMLCALLRPKRIR